MATSGKKRALQLEDMVRFNEAIDQALAESVTSYPKEVQKPAEAGYGGLIEHTPTCAKPAPHRVDPYTEHRPHLVA